MNSHLYNNVYAYKYAYKYANTHINKLNIFLSFVSLLKIKCTYFRSKEIKGMFYFTVEIY